MKKGIHKAGDRTVLVTGAASGLGLEISKLFLAKGDHVILTDLHQEVPAKVEALSGNWRYRKLDITSDEDWADAAADLASLDILVCNAGIAVGGRMTETSMETWRRAVDINFLGAVRGIRTMLPKINRGGRIALTASLAGLVHAPAMAAYNTTKAATVALAETLDAELRHRKISVSAICPQFFKSGLADSLMSDDAESDEMARKLLQLTWLDAPTVARRAVWGIEARRVIITPDVFATVNWYFKRFARIPYLVSYRAIGWATNAQSTRAKKQADQSPVVAEQAA